MAQLVDVMVSLAGIDRTKLAEVAEKLLDKASRQCGSPYYRIVFEGAGPQGRVALVVLATSAGVKGEYTNPPGANMEGVTFSMVKVECLTAGEFASELKKAHRPRICAACGVSRPASASVAPTARFEPIKFIQGYIDSKLSLRLASDPFWYMRLLMKSQRVVTDEGDANKAVSTLLDLASRYRRALVVLRDASREFRLYINSNKAGVAYIEGSSFDIGVSAIDKARDMRGKLEGYRLLSRSPTLTI